MSTHQLYDPELIEKIRAIVIRAEQPHTWGSIELAHRDIKKRLARFTGLHDEVLCANCEDAMGHHSHRGLYCPDQAGMTPMQLQFWPLLCQFIDEEGVRCDAFATVYEFDEKQGCDNRALCGNCLTRRFRSRC